MFYWLLHNLQWRLLPNVVEVANGVRVMTQVVIVEARVQTRNNLFTCVCDFNVRL